MNISVASGTGGTGKTPSATSLVLILSRREPATFLNCDLYPPLTEKLAEWYAERDAMLMGRVPFDPGVADAMVAGIPLLEYTTNRTARAVRWAWEGALSLLNGKEPEP